MKSRKFPIVCPNLRINDPGSGRYLVHKQEKKNAQHAIRCKQFTTPQNETKWFFFRRGTEKAGLFMSVPKQTITL